MINKDAGELFGVIRAVSMLRAVPPICPYISLYLPMSPYISLYLPISPYISLYLRPAELATRAGASRGQQARRSLAAARPPGGAW